MEFVPTDLKCIFLRMGENIEFMCKTAAIPGSTLPVVEVPFRGHRLKIAGDRTFEDWTVTIINDIGFTARTAVENWMSSIQELDSGVGATNFRLSCFKSNYISIK